MGSTGLLSLRMLTICVKVAIDAKDSGSFLVVI